MPISFWILVALTFIFTYVNGFHDGCNVVATLIASRSMRPYPALAWAAVVEVLSPFAILAIGSSVSDTIKKIVAESFYTNPEAKSIALAFITAGILAAILWNLVTWLLAIPASSSHALIGGVVGAGLAAFGSSAISWNYFWDEGRSDDLRHPDRQLYCRVSDFYSAALSHPKRQFARAYLLYLCTVVQHELSGV